MNNYKLNRRKILTYAGFLSASVFFLKPSIISNIVSDRVVLKTHKKVQKLAIFQMPQDSNINEFKSNISKWVNLDKYDQIKYEYIKSGKILKSHSRYSNNKAYFFTEFSSDNELINFENDLIKHNVFNSSRRKKMRYYVTEYFHLKRSIT